MCTLDKSFKLRPSYNKNCLFYSLFIFFIAMCMGGYNIKNNQSLMERSTVNIQK